MNMKNQNQSDDKNLNEFSSLLNQSIYDKILFQIQYDVVNIIIGNSKNHKILKNIQIHCVHENHSFVEKYTIHSNNKWISQ